MVTFMAAVVGPHVLVEVQWPGKPLRRDVEAWLQARHNRWWGGPMVFHVDHSIHSPSVLCCPVFVPEQQVVCFLFEAVYM
jgi:hypothetical protein